jgi:hypothetical protein
MVTLWYAAMVGISAFAVILGWQIDLVVAAVFWTVATLFLLAVRPYD